MWSRTDILAMTTIVVAIIVLGAFCSHLNYLFYLKHGPFYDSMSYYDTLARVMLAARSDGLPKGLSSLWNSTVALPWIEAAIFAPFVHPSRAVGVCIYKSVGAFAPMVQWKSSEKSSW